MTTNFDDMYFPDVNDPTQMFHVNRFPAKVTQLYNLRGNFYVTNLHGELLRRLVMYIVPCNLGLIFGCPHVHSTRNLVNDNIIDLRDILIYMS